MDGWMGGVKYRAPNGAYNDQNNPKQGKLKITYHRPKAHGGEGESPHSIKIYFFFSMLSKKLAHHTMKISFWSIKQKLKLNKPMGIVSELHCFHFLKFPDCKIDSCGFVCQLFGHTNSTFNSQLI